MFSTIIFGFFFFAQDLVILQYCKIIIRKICCVIVFEVEMNCIRINIILAGGNNVTRKLNRFM